MQKIKQLVQTAIVVKSAYAAFVSDTCVVRIGAKAQRTAHKEKTCTN